MIPLKIGTVSSRRAWRPEQRIHTTGWKSIFPSWQRRKEDTSLKIQLLVTFVIFMPAAADVARIKSVDGKFADVNGLKMYYEIHGSGKPLVLIHGAFGTAEGWGMVLPALSKSHQVIIVELQGHGHTADRAKP